MRFISAQPDSDYYIWQLEVQMHNFSKFGIEQDAIILFGYNGDMNINALKFAKRTKAIVLFYPDTRKTKRYVSTIRPHILKQFFANIPAFIRLDQWMYHDADIIFLNQPDFSLMEDGVVHVSNSGVNSYLSSKYIKSKSESLFTNMCEAVGIRTKEVIDNDPICGGAQYIFDFTPTFGFWQKVEIDCNRLWDLMTTGEYAHDLNNASIELNDAIATGQPREDILKLKRRTHPIQAWTADMWALLWNLWLYPKETRISSELDFLWPTEGLMPLHKNILHNSGVTESQKHLFLKQAYSHKSPFGANFDHIDKCYYSWLYVKEIIETSESLQR